MRRTPVPVIICSLTALAVCAPLAAQAAPTAPAPTSGFSTTAVGDLPLLTDPFLQSPLPSGVHVVWMTERPGDRHVVLTGDGVDDLTERELAEIADGRRGPRGVKVHRAGTTRLSRVAEDARSQLPDATRPTSEDGIVERDVFRHEAVVRGLRPGSEVPYRVLSADGALMGASATFTLSPAARPGEPQRILLTSDHQSMVNTPANLQVAAATIGTIDAVFQAGDLVNVPDRASEWFDDSRGSAWFPVLQGHGGRTATNGRVYTGAPIIQSAPLFAAVGNHEVQGRIAGATSLSDGNSSVPRDVAAAAYEAVADEVNPKGDPAVRGQWIEDNSFSTTTYEEILTLPESRPGGETYYATTVGDVRLITLYATRMWRGTANDADPAARTSTSRYQEAAQDLSDPLAQGYGEFVYEGLEKGSEQYEWLARELRSPEFRKARYTVVMMHEGPQGLGDNIAPAFTDPVRIEERDAAGALIGVRYEYPVEDNMLTRDVQPMLETAGVDLVYSGHSHLWNRFEGDGGTVFLEASNTGNSYGAFHELSGRSRHVPGAPWDASNYLAQGNPGGLEPVIPTVNPLRAVDGTPLPFVQDNDIAVFSVLDTGSGEVTTWTYDLRTPDEAPVVLDRFPLTD
ncbi:metallophosphoesterase family protein [Blastococcus sp. SYSU DS0619]